MKIAIIGTGRVGSTTAFSLLEKEEITELLLINRTKAKADELKADLVSAFPKLGNKILIKTLEYANDADIIMITAGAFGAPSGKSLWETNKPTIKELFKTLKPKKSAKIIVVTTPIDQTSKLAWKLSGLKPTNIIGFGGQLDKNRLEYLIRGAIDDFSKEIKVDFIGKHGSEGIPIFSEPVKNREKIIQNTKNYYGVYLANYAVSTYGTAKELVRLVEALLLEEEQTFTISHYDSKHDLFVTWPCIVNRDGVGKPTELTLTAEEQKELDSLIKTRKEKESE